MTTPLQSINLVTPPSSPGPPAEDDAPREGKSEKRSAKAESLPLYDSDDSVVEVPQAKKQRAIAWSSPDVDLKLLRRRRRRVRETR